MFDALILNSKRYPEESQTESVSRRLQQVDEGDWGTLWDELVCNSVIRSRGEENPARARKAKAELVRALALAGEESRAIKTVRSSVPPMTDSSRAKEVENLYPKATEVLQAPADTAFTWSDEEYEQLANDIRKYLGRAPVRKREDLLGSRLEHWAVLRHAPTGLKAAGLLLAKLYLGLVPPEMVDVHSVGEIIDSEAYWRT